MISRRNYFAITILMATVLFLCMCLNSLKDGWNDYAVNRYTETAENYPSQINMYLPGGEEEEPAPEEGTEDVWSLAAASRDRVVWIGPEDSALYGVVEAWVTYTKRDIAAYPSLTALKAAEGEGTAWMLVTDPACVDWESGEELELLEGYVEAGTHLVLPGLPEVSVIEGNKKLRDFLGIRKVLEQETTVTGYYLREGFLLGGGTFYLDRESPDAEELLPGSEAYPGEKTFPWYLPGYGTKVYMRGIAAGGQVKAENYPIMLWRKSHGTASVFAVNGGLMDGLQGMGLLSAMAAETDSYGLYPVVNAQNMILAGYPSLADENPEEMERLYSRSVKQVFQELLWPNIAAVLEKHRYKATCMMTPQYDYTDDNLPDGRQLAYYLKIFNEHGAETGLWGLSVSDTPLAGKLASDGAFLREALGGYGFASLYAGDMEALEIREALGEELLGSVRTVVREHDGAQAMPVGFLSEGVTAQRVIGDGLTYTYESDFLVRCMETALGYFSISFDLSRVAYPEEDGDGWEQLSKTLGTTIGTYGQAFRGFHPTTASECDARIRQFLALDYRDDRIDDTIYLQVEGITGPAWFVLRTHNEAIEDMEGGSWQELEEGAYLIEVTDKRAVLTLKPADERFYR